MKLRVGRTAESNDLAVFDDDHDAALPVLVIGPYSDTSEAARWAHWYVSKRMMPDDTTDWPLKGKLECYFSNYQEDSDDDFTAVLYVISGEPVGTLGWNGEEWWFYGLEFDLSTAVMDHGEDYDEAGMPSAWNTFVNVDPEALPRHREEKAEILQKPAVIQSALLAERQGRLKAFRDETLSIAHERGKMEARRVWRRRHPGLQSV